METDLIPFNQNEIKKVIGKDGEIENFTISQTKKGYRKLELQIYYPQGYRKFFILKDKGSIIQQQQISIQEFFDKKTRNNEIYRLYNKEHMTQDFIAKIFGLKQPTISGIIKKIK